MHIVMNRGSTTKMIHSNIFNSTINKSECNPKNSQRKAHEGKKEECEEQKAE